MKRDPRTLNRCRRNNSAVELAHSRLQIHTRDPRGRVNMYIDTDVSGTHISPKFRVIQAEINKYIEINLPHASYVLAQYQQRFERTVSATVIYISVLHYMTGKRY
jgi:hypothetical protein